MSISANFPNVFPSLELNFAQGQQLDPRVTFSRSTTAPYYDGKTSVLAEQNLLLQSQFASNWSLSGGLSSLTLNATTAPDGTNTASQIIENANNTYHGIYQSTLSGLSAGTYTVSCFAKAGTNAYLIFNLYDTTNRLASFNLSTGTLGTITSGGTGVITSFGNGWYRCSFTYTGTTGPNGTSLIIAMSNSDNLFSYTGNAGNYIYIWGSQLEQRSSVTAYNATTTSAITNYIPQLLTAPINAPRFDFNPTTGESLGLLIEQSSTNLLTYSQDLSNAVWSKTRSSITSNTIVAPDGTLTGDKLVEDTTNNSHFVFQSTTVSSGAQYTSTIFAKAGERGYLTLFVQGTTAAANTFFNLINGTIVSTSSNATSSITRVGNGWYRCSVTTTTNSTGMVNYWGISADGTNASYAGDGYSGIYIWGAQLEALAFPTSYIPTTSAQVTRASDNASMTGTNFSSWYNNAQGTAYVETSRPTNVGQNTAYTISDGSTGNNIIWTTYNTSLYETIIKNSGTTSADMFASITYLINFSYKNAVTYASNSFAVVLNGAAPLTDSSGLVPVSCSALYLGSTWVNSVYLNGWIKKFSYYPTQLTSAQLQAITGS